MQKDVHADDDLTRLVVDYYRQLWLRKRGVQDPAIYSALPLTMQAEIAHKTYETMFEQVVRNRQHWARRPILCVDIDVMMIVMMEIMVVVITTMIMIIMMIITIINIIIVA